MDADRRSRSDWLAGDSFSRSGVLRDAFREKNLMSRFKRACRGWMLSVESLKTRVPFARHSVLSMTVSRE